MATVRIVKRSYKAKLQDWIHQFHEENGRRPFTQREVAEWAISKGLWKPPQRSIVDQLARELARAARDEFITDPQGRRVRILLARKDEVQLPNGEWTQQTWWDDMRSAERDHVHASLQQMRKMSLYDNHQIKMIQDSFNENWNTGKPLELSFDYREDLAEMEQPTEYPQKPEDEDEEEI